jgi:hypothetical protein
LGNPARDGEAQCRGFLAWRCGSNRPGERNKLRAATVSWKPIELNHCITPAAMGNEWLAGVWEIARGRQVQSRGGGLDRKRDVCRRPKARPKAEGRRGQPEPTGWRIRPKWQTALPPSLIPESQRVFRLACRRFYLSTRERKRPTLLLKSPPPPYSLGPQ